MIEISITPEQAEGLQRHVAIHMDNCFESLEQDDSDSFVDEEGNLFEPYGAFCGCDTCQTREQLMATFHYLRKNNIVDIFVDENE
jgi:hypothetical protein